MRDFCECARGNECISRLQVSQGKGTLVLLNSLLQMTGSDKRQDSLCDADSGSYLLWNGEIFDGLSIGKGQNDGVCLLQQLSKCDTQDDFARCFSSLRGPWAAIYFHNASKTIWFGKDVMGRKSLLIKKPSPTDSTLIISSVLGTRFAESQVEEIPPGIYCMKVEIFLDGLVREEYDFDSIIEKMPWQDECLLALSSFRRAFDEANAGVNPGSNRVEKTHALIQILRESVSKRCVSIEYPSVTDNNPEMLGQSRYMVLFSGGVDSTLVASLMHSVLPATESIDLCSICFAKGDSPDRMSAIDAFQELKETCNGREWRFIEINSSYSEVQDSLSHLLEILFPCDTVMDFNIGGALWMASNGVGAWVDYLPNENGGHKRLMIEPAYHSRARTVFMGHGADELFGGYGRHRTKFRNFGLPGLSEELRLDIRRLWKRNFGRDDRVISDHGKEARLPFMDEEVIRFALETDLEVLVDLNLPVGEGDKIILRNCLRTLGLGRTAQRQKRALQFGSRLAKAANEAQFGGTRKANQHFAGKVRLSEVPLANTTSQSLGD